jgi:hypothetical protein
VTAPAFAPTKDQAYTVLAWLVRHPDWFNSLLVIAENSDPKDPRPQWQQVADKRRKQLALDTR